jgi:hypothetical protein
MAKVIGGLFPVSGTIDDTVFVRRGDTTYTRRRVRPGSKRNEPVLMEHYLRTPYLNRLASGINSILQNTSNRNKHGEFYAEVLGRFRKQASDNTFLLLSALNGMNLHPTYTLDIVGGSQKISVKTERQKFKVRVNITSQPLDIDKVNCYCYQLVLITWNNTDKPPTYDHQASEWIYPEKPKTQVDFSFQRETGVVHWMLCVMKQMGFNDEDVSVKLQGMCIMQVGTFNKEDLALQKEIAAEEKKKMAAFKKKKERFVRVKATR